MGMVNFDLWHIYKQAASQESSRFHDKLHTCNATWWIVDEPAS